MIFWLRSAIFIERHDVLLSKVSHVYNYFQYYFDYLPETIFLHGQKALLSFLQRNQQFLRKLNGSMKQEACSSAL